MKRVNSSRGLKQAEHAQAGRQPQEDELKAGTKSLDNRKYALARAARHIVIVDNTIV